MYVCICMYVYVCMYIYIYIYIYMIGRMMCLPKSWIRQSYQWQNIFGNLMVHQPIKVQQAFYFLGVNGHPKSLAKQHLWYVWWGRRRRALEFTKMDVSQNVVIDCTLKYSGSFLFGWKRWFWLHWPQSLSDKKAKQTADGNCQFKRFFFG